ncbi:MAG: hypothetical protein KDA54_06485 [Phycisphaerales bacterium]|nr:hypothetical protein [Phycisphaerales bacterium]
MSHRERNKSDRGRSRSIKARDRAQMYFDDLMIDEYINDEDALDVHEREVIKVRYGVRRLADHLSDSTIAYHVLGLGDDAPDNSQSMELDVIDDSAPLLSTSPKTPPAIVTPQTFSRQENSYDDTPEQFSVKGILSGMAYGSAAGLGLLLVLRMLV